MCAGGTQLGKGRAAHFHNFGQQPPAVQSPVRAAIHKEDPRNGRAEEARWACLMAGPKRMKCILAFQDNLRNCNA